MKDDFENRGYVYRGVVDGHRMFVKHTATVEQLPPNGFLQVFRNNLFFVAIAVKDDQCLVGITNGHKGEVAGPFPVAETLTKLDEFDKRILSTVK